MAFFFVYITPYLHCKTKQYTIMQPIHHLSMIAAWASLISVQTGAAFAKSLFPLVGPEGVVALRIGITAIILTVVFKPWRLKLESSSWVGLIIYGCMIGLMNTLIYRAFLYIPVGIAISIEVLGPIGLSLLSSKRRADVVWILFALLGVMLLPYNQSNVPLNIIGIMFAVFAAISWGLYINVASKVVAFGSQGVAVGIGVAALFTVPAGIVHAGSTLLTSHALAFGFIVAILSSTLPFLLDMYALRKLPKNIFSVLMSASPAVSAIAGWIVLGEALSAIQWCGIGAISIACVGATMPRHGIKSTSLAKSELNH